MMSNTVHVIYHAPRGECSAMYNLSGPAARREYQELIITLTNRRIAFRVFFPPMEL